MQNAETGNLKTLEPGTWNLELSESTSAVLYDAGRRSWLRLSRPEAVYSTRDPNEACDLLRRVEADARRRKRYAAGWVAYTAAPGFDPAMIVRPDPVFPLLWFGLFSDAEPVDLPSMDPLLRIGWTGGFTQAEHRQAVDRIKEHIARGETYQVNLTHRLLAPATADAWRLLVGLVRAQGATYGAFIETEEWAVCSASPELFFAKTGDRLVSRPMKGTMPRGMRSIDDDHLAQTLERSTKNRAENLMIVDMVRNDMGRIAETGTVRAGRLFDLEKYATLWQMTSQVECRTRAGLADVFEALFPAASITGAPKVRTMRIIADLETSSRTLYTGAIGLLMPDGNAQFNVAIRTVLIDKRARTMEYGVGGGIVWDSDPEDEWKECATKTLVLEPPTPEFALLETLKWTPDSGFAALEEHLARMADSAAYFDRAFASDAARMQLDTWAASAPARAHRVRLLADADGSCRLEAAELCPLPDPYRVKPARTPIRSSDARLYHKTSDRRVYEKARAEAGDGADDVLLWNERGEITESGVANVAVERDGVWLTPPISAGLLPGIERARLLREGRAREQTLPLTELRPGETIHLFNSVRGCWRGVLVPD